jgi:hypothetical protein
MSKTSTTLYVVQDPKGNVMSGTADFGFQECRNKFLQMMTGSSFHPTDWGLYLEQGFKMLEINLPKELDKFND